MEGDNRDTGTKIREKKLRSSKARNQAEAHVDVVGLAAAATDEGPKVLGAIRWLRV